MPIKNVRDQSFNVVTGVVRTTGYKTGAERTRMKPTPDSLTQRRKKHFAELGLTRKKTRKGGRLNTHWCGIVDATPGTFIGKSKGIK